MEKRDVLEILVIVILFLGFSYVIQENLEIVKRIIPANFFGMFLYILATTIAVVIAPISATPLVPVASNLWGWFLTGILSMIGWTLGAFIAFSVSRKYGVPLIRKFIPLKKIYKIEKMLPSEHIFWSVVFLRMFFPVDLLSYALGLFSKMSRRDYLFATIIGMTPFAFIFAYLGIMPLVYQILAFVVAFIIILVGLFVRKRVKGRRGAERNVVI